MLERIQWGVIIILLINLIQSQLWLKEARKDLKRFQDGCLEWGKRYNGLERALKEALRIVEEVAPERGSEIGVPDYVDVWDLDEDDEWDDEDDEDQVDDEKGE